LTEFDILLPSSSRVFGDNALEAEMAAAAMNTSRIQDITLAEQSFDVSAVARGVEAMGMGEEDLLGHDDNFKLDLDDDFVLSPGPQGDTSMLEPEMGRDAMQGLDDSMIRPEGLSLVGKDGALLLPGDISREDLNDDLGGDILRFGDDGLDISMGPDSAMVPNTQEVALQEAEAAVLAAANKDATERQAKRRRLNMSDLVTNEATSLSPDEIRGHLNDASDIVRVPTYLPSTRAPRLDALSSAAVASRFLAATSVSPFDALFENTGMDPFEQEVPSFVGGADAGIAEGEEFRMDDFDDLDFGAGMGEDLAGIAGQPDDQSILLGDKSVEQLERLEEESFLRLADEQQGDGVRLFAEDLPVRDEDLSMQATQLAALATQDHEDVLATTPGASDALGSGYSKNTIRAIHLIDSECRKANIPTADSVAESEKPLSYLNVSKGAQRSDAVKLFFELLVLKSKNFVDVKQEEPFEDILIAPRDKLRQAADNNHHAAHVISTVLGSLRDVHSHALDLNARTDGSSKGATSGFVKIDKSSKTAKATAEEEEVESESTLTPKTLLEKLKWEQSGERMQRLRLRAKDKDLEGWQRRKIEWRIKKVEGDKAGETWGPTKKLATSSMEKIRLLNAEFPNEWTIKKLSDQFHVSQEAVRRIIKSKFRPTEERTRKREAKRKEQIEQYRKGTFKHAKDRADDRSE
ncbi:sister chromatid cohesion protein 1, partial [Linderina macrospora]